MAKQTNPFDSTGHRIVLMLAILFLIMSVGVTLTPPPITTNVVSIGAGIGEAMGKIFLTFLSVGAACIGIVVSVGAMGVAKGKKKTAINKQARWYLLFYFIVLTLPLLLTMIIL